MTSRLHNPSLMKGQGTEAAPSKTATVTDQTELDFFDCRNPSVFFITRMVSPHIRKAIHQIHLVLRKRFCRWILYNIKMIAVRLYETFPRKRICITILHIKTSCIIELVLFQSLIGWKNCRFIDTVQTLRLINRSSDKCDITDRNTAVQSFCDLNDRMFSHSIRYQICTGIQQDRTF